MNLHRQFPGGGEDQGPGSRLVTAGNRVLQQVVKHGQQKAAVLPVPVWACPATS